jgi:hypothetical protein
LKNHPKVYAVKLVSSGILKGLVSLSLLPLLPITAPQYYHSLTSSYP